MRGGRSMDAGGSGMSPTVAARSVPSIEERLHLTPKPAKAGLETVKKVRLDGWPLLASLMRRAFQLKGYTQKEAAAALDMSESALADQLACNKRPQFERLIACDNLRGQALVAQAEAMPEQFDVLTTITVRVVR